SRCTSSRVIARRRSASQPSTRVSSRLPRLLDMLRVWHREHAARDDGYIKLTTFHRTETGHHLCRYAAIHALVKVTGWPSAGRSSVRSTNRPRTRRACDRTVTTGTRSHPLFASPPHVQPEGSTNLHNAGPLPMQRWWH